MAPLQHNDIKMTRFRSQGMERRAGGRFWIAAWHEWSDIRPQFLF